MDAVRALNAEVLDAYTGELLQQWLIKDHQIGCCYHKVNLTLILASRLVLLVTIAIPWNVQLIFRYPNPNPNTDLGSFPYRSNREMQFNQHKFRTT